MRRLKPIFAVCIAILTAVGVTTIALFAAPASYAQTVDRAAVAAAEEFRRGVQAFNRYAFNEAILSFEKALAFKNNEPLILDWLGRAYYRSGLEDTALRQWQSAISLYQATSAEGLRLNGLIQTVRNRRSLYPELDENARYVEAGRFPAKNGDLTVYSQPTSLLPNPDGSVWAVAYGSNEIVRFDPNGVVRTRMRGPLNGFDRPYDIARAPDGRLYLSEYKGDRVSVLDKAGNWTGYIGERGRGPGQFVGPQNISVDADGYLYVVDFGNRRVSKFAPDGAFILSFGSRSADFPGFTVPTGIAVIGEEVFVADAAARRIARFDPSGNFSGFLAEGWLKYPESLRATDDGKLIVSDSSRVLLVDPIGTLVRELALFPERGARIIGADADANGNIVAADFSAGEVTVLTRLNDLSAGLFVQIERIVSDRFPEVQVELRVEDRQRRPIIGLEALNFLLTEEGRPVSGQTFLGSPPPEGPVEIAVLVERSPATANRGADIAEVVADAVSGADTLAALVSAGEQPVKERLDRTSATTLSAAAKARPESYSSRWRFDMGLRLAATELLAGEKRRAVVFITSGRMGERSFERYGLTESASYLANNGIVFYAVVLGDEAVDRELAFLCAQTGGSVVRAYRPEGIAPVIRALKNSSVGSYSFKYTSTLPTDFGRAYLPVEAEAYLMVRSGRDSTGYFPPLE